MMASYITVPLYAGLFCLGVTGNIWVIRMIFEIKRQTNKTNQKQCMKDNDKTTINVRDKINCNEKYRKSIKKVLIGEQRRQARPKTSTSSSSETSKSILVYVLALSIVDLCVTLCIPFILSDMLTHGWMWGDVVCKLYYSIESINKFLSSWIMCAVGIDRYLTICLGKPASSSMASSWWRSPYLMIGACVVLTMVALTPLFLHATLYEYHSTLLNASTIKCILNMSNDMRQIFIIEAFVLGYCLPAVIITFCYTKLLSFTMAHNHQSMISSRIPLRKVTVSALRVVLFYYAVWTPYWLFTASFLWHLFDYGYGITLIAYGLHALPYFNSSLNWVWYALLNRQLRTSYETALTQRLLNKRVSMEVNNLNNISKKSTVSQPDCPNTTRTLMVVAQTNPLDPGSASAEMDTDETFVDDHHVVIPL